MFEYNLMEQYFRKLYEICGINSVLPSKQDVNDDKRSSIPLDAISLFPTREKINNDPMETAS